MGFLIQFAIQTVSELFGHAVGHKRPWWVGFAATLGCFVVLLMPLLLLILLD